MWTLLLLFLAAGLGLSSLPERQARLLVVPVVLGAVAFEALTSGLL